MRPFKKDVYEEEQFYEYEYDPDYNVEILYEQNLLDTLEDLMKDSLRTKISLLPGWIE